MAPEHVDQIGHRNAEDGARETILQASHQCRDVASKRHPVQADRRIGLLRAYPRHEPPDVPHRLSGGVHVVEHVLAREGGTPVPARTVQRKRGQQHVQTEIVMQVPGTEQPQINRSPPHQGAVYAHHPGPGLAMPQHQGRHAGVRGVTQPPVTAGFAWTRLVPTVEDHAFVDASANPHRPVRDVGQRGGASKNSSGLSSQPRSP